MDNKELVERITREVMAKLSGTAASAASGGTAPAAPAPAAAPVPAAPAASAPAGAELAKYIDHTILKPDATQAQVDAICAEAAQYRFASVCVNSHWVAYCAKKLRGTGVKVCGVVGFPLGAMDSRTKGFETRGAVENGADEIDMVINVGALKSGDLKTVEEDIRSVLRACRQTTKLKVILECCLLTEEEKVTACTIVKKCGAHFVKTSTGFSTSGATVQDVALMRRTVGPEMGVKAAGGIRSAETAQAMIRAGATRIGASASVAIVTGATSTAKY